MATVEGKLNELAATALEKAAALCDKRAEQNRRLWRLARGVTRQSDMETSYMLLAKEDELLAMAIRDLRDTFYR